MTLWESFAQVTELPFSVLVWIRPTSRGPASRLSHLWARLCLWKNCPGDCQVVPVAPEGAGTARKPLHIWEPFGGKRSAGVPGVAAHGPGPPGGEAGEALGLEARSGDQQCRVLLSWPIPRCVCARELSQLLGSLSTFSRRLAVLASANLSFFKQRALQAPLLRNHLDNRTPGSNCRSFSLSVSLHTN